MLQLVHAFFVVEGGLTGSRNPPPTRASPLSPQRISHAEFAAGATTLLGAIDAGERSKTILRRSTSRRVAS